MLSAPPVIDDLGSVNLSMHCRWNGEAVFVIASAFVDETGTGTEPRMIVGAVVASAMRWHTFSVQWQEMLNDENVAYAHYLEMHNRRGPFANGWYRERKARFLKRQLTILRESCQLGLTVSLDKQLYKDVYLKDFPARKPKDSPYGVASKELILWTQRHCADYLRGIETINFVWEEGHLNLPNVQEIFRNLKLCYGDQAKSLGAFIPLNKTKALPLQAVDQLVVSARKAEAAAKAAKKFVTLPLDADMDYIQSQMEPGERFPVFYHELTEDRLMWHRNHAVEMHTLLRQAKGRSA